jgi:glutamine amidotransferase
MQHNQFLEHYPGLLSSIYLAHVRHKTIGGAPTHADTHPFCREMNGRDYCFAHNGTLAGEFWQRPLGRFRPVGSTDSEFLFCLLLAELEEFAQLKKDAKNANAPPLTTEHLWKWLHEFLLRLNEYGKLNCILTDGDQMIVYHDKNGWKGLTHRKVYLHEDSQHHFSDANVAVNLQAEPVNHGVIVATNPLSVEGWERFLPGEMKVVKQGTIAFAMHAALRVKENGKSTMKEPQAEVARAPGGVGIALPTK